MADAPAQPPAKAGGKGFWTHKLGPFPVWVWALGVGAVGAYYWYTHYGPGASSQQSGQQQAGQQPRQRRTPTTRITKTIIRRGGRGRRGPRPSFGTDTATPAAQAAAAGIPAQSGGGPGAGGTMAGTPAPPPDLNAGGPMRPPDKDRDRKRDRDRRRVAVGSQEQTTVIHDQPTGQPVDPATGQPVYWEWTHAHRGPEISRPVPEPQRAYAPGTTGATYAATGADAADAAVA